MSDDRNTTTCPTHGTVAPDHSCEYMSPLEMPLTSDDFDMIDQALGVWSSDDNDAPHEAIANLRERLRDVRSAR